MPFDQLDTRLFRAFLSAVKTGSFTMGAQKAGMTQSGMSQQIGRLEEQLGAPLFERVNKKVFLTPAGEQLKAFIETYSETVESFVESVTHGQTSPRGLVRYAMPSFCLKTPHFPLLLEKRRDFSLVDLQVHLLANDEILSRLLKGEIDFGFVTQREVNPALTYKPFAQEEYVLVASDKKWIDELNAGSIDKLRYINYPGFGALFDIWRHQFFPRRITLTEYTLSIAGWINDLDGAITMVLHGVGCTVLPKHCVEDLLRTKKLYAYYSREKPNPIGIIYLVTRTNSTAPRRVQTVIENFLEMKKRD